MLHEIQIPELGESVTGGVIAGWLREEGASVAAGEPLLDLETDKVSMQVLAPAAGALSISVAAGETVRIGQVVGTIDDTAARPARPVAASAGPAATGPAVAPAPAVPALVPPAGVAQVAAKLAGGAGADRPLSPAVRRLVAEQGLDPRQIPASGPGGRLTKGDVLQQLSAGQGAVAGERQSRQRLSPLRQRIAERLVLAQREAAMLTTFNEADMSAVLRWRAEQREPFAERHGLRLGFMSFFIKAVVDALRRVPGLNAFLDGDELVQNHFFDIGVAVSTERGLLVPVIRGCDQLGFAALERAVADFAERARQRTITLDELSGGCFTISNGGVFGSLLSTPILNPPQAGILGLHAIKERPMAERGQVVIRPMMYLALSYDHRIVDGREAVTFLRRVVECIEHPERMMLEV